MENWLNDLPPLRKERKVKHKAVPVIYRHDYKTLYFQARRKMFEREYPAAWKAGEYFDGKLPDIKTTNGFTRYITDVINNIGHHAERVNTGGVPMFKNGKPVLDDKGKQKYRISGSTNGSTDIHCEIIILSQSLPAGWKIEVKNKDTVLKAQAKYQAKMQRVGVLHTILHGLDMDGFWDEYFKIIAL